MFLEGLVWPSSLLYSTFMFNILSVSHLKTHLFEKIKNISSDCDKFTFGSIIMQLNIDELMQIEKKCDTLSPKNINII